MPQIDFEPLSEPTSKVDFEPLDQSTKASRIDFQPLEESKPPKSPTPASDKALAETPVSPASTFSFKTPQQMDVADQKMIAPYLADAATGVAQGVKEMVPKSMGAAAKMLFYTPIEETPHALKEAYDVLRGVPIEQAVPESQTYKGFTQKPLTEQAKIVTGQVLPLALGLTGLRESLRPRIGEPNAVERGNAQVQEGTAPLGVEARPEGEVPKPSDSNNVVGKTSGEGGLARPPQETPQPLAAKPEAQTQGQPSQETGQTKFGSVDLREGDFPPEQFAKMTQEDYVNSQSPTSAADIKVYQSLYRQDVIAAMRRYEISPEEAKAKIGDLPSLNVWIRDLNQIEREFPGQERFSIERKVNEGEYVSPYYLEKYGLKARPVPEVQQAPTVAGEKPTVGADVGAVPPTEANEPHVSAIANRFVQERAARGELGRITPGRGFSREDLVQGGLTMPPEVINQHVSDLMQGTGDIVKQGQAVRAEEARLSARSNQLSRVAEANPQNMEAKMAADNAFKDLEDFHNGPVATLKQKWHATGLEMQGEIPVDLSTFNGLRQQWLRDVGEAPPAKVEPELRRAAQNVSKAIVEDNGARSKLAQEIDKEATRRKYPNADEVRNNIRERMGLEPCRT